MTKLRLPLALLLLGASGALQAVGEEPTYTPAERGHWSFLPRRNTPTPQFQEQQHRDWVRNPIDAYMLRRLLAAELPPASEATAAVLTRRLYFQLSGLPPTPEQLEDRLRDPSPDAHERLVDRLLADPRYGEHWAQHWLDVVRFAESEGFEYDRYRPGAWRFRDYVVRSLNAGKPYDQFLREQLAGDEFTADTPFDAVAGGPEERAWLDARIASGFHRLGPIRRNAGNPEVAFSRNEVLTEMTDIIGASMLGVTLGCARCHDHMFDPIRQSDYYRMQAYLAATHEDNVVLAGPSTRKEWETKREKIEKQLTKAKGELPQAEGQRADQLKAAIAELEARLPAPLPTVSAVRNDSKQRTAVHVLDRGLETLKGRQVGMRPLGVLLPDDAPESAADTRAPKSKLAHWITDPEHPLTARVIVNRLWHYHFGQGLVATPNDFGANGDSPSHPELLDFLANELVRHDWRLKPIHRLILTSSTFRQSGRSDHSRRGARIDPENRLLWKYSRRRLEAQELRDAMLAVSGRLNDKMHGKSVMLPVDQELVDLLYKPSQWQLSSRESDHSRRSVYLIAKRNLRLPFMEVFDQPDMQSTCSRRVSSTHAPQALELLNGRTANALAQVFADRLQRECGSDAEKISRRAYLLAAGRLPKPAEQQICETFLSQHSLREFALAMFSLNAFVYVD